MYFPYWNLFTAKGHKKFSKIGSIWLKGSRDSVKSVKIRNRICDRNTIVCNKCFIVTVVYNKFKKKL